MISLLNMPIETGGQKPVLSLSLDRIDTYRKPLI